jgi:hypothetical protein
MRAVRLILDARVPGRREWRLAGLLLPAFFVVLGLDADVLGERVVVSTRE